jgi:SET domain-containing protein
MSGQTSDMEADRRRPDATFSTAQRAHLTVKDFGARGRGIVALEDIEPGRLIERSPVLIIPAEQRAAIDRTIIFTYVFMWEHHTVEEDLYKHEGRSAIALGYTSLLSHSYEPNCIFVRHIDELFIDVFAKRPIKAGEELTIDYQMTLWFDPVPVD